MTHDSEGCCIQRGKYPRHEATLFLAATGDSARAASCKGKDLHGSVGDAWLHHHKETKQTKFRDRAVTVTWSLCRERAMPRLSIPSMERHSPFCIFFPIFFTSYWLSTQPPFTTFTARSGPTQDRYLCGNGQWPVATDVLHFLRSYFLSGTGGLLSITLPLAVAFVRNSDFICAFRAADRVLILLILICYQLFSE